MLTDKQWELLELLLPKSHGHVGRNFANNRLIVERMLYRLRTSLPWRDLPEVRGSLSPKPGCSSNRPLADFTESWKAVFA
ncbi:transposase [Nocardia wallacei]|uniref:transposase n=1 Tax=Nocardia wallacei TaxID=480035 RepID=UPI003CC7CF24